MIGSAHSASPMHSAHLPLPSQYPPPPPHVSPVERGSFTGTLWMHLSSVQSSPS
jgi:hypothetical protein